MPLHVSSRCAHHQEVKIALHSLWYHHTYMWPFRAQVEKGLVGMHSNQYTYTGGRFTTSPLVEMYVAYTLEKECVLL